MRLSKRELKIIIENYLFESEKEKNDIEEDNDYEYKRDSSAQYGWTFRKKNAQGVGVGKFKPINKAGGENLDNKYGPTKSVSSGKDSNAPKKEERKVDAKDYLQFIVDSEGFTGPMLPPEGHNLKNQKRLGQIGPARKPYPQGQVVRYIQLAIGMEDSQAKGVYSPSTAKKVAAFQSRHKLNSVGSKTGDVPGIVGPATARFLLTKAGAGQKGKGANAALIHSKHAAANNPFMTFVGMKAQTFRYMLDFVGFSDAISSIIQKVPALHAAFMLEYLTLRQADFEIRGAKYKKAMSYVIKAAKNRQGGKQSGNIEYDDYYQGQILDPAIGKDKAEPIVYSSHPKADTAEKVFPGTYGQLSLVFGSAKYNGNTVSDVYDFNLTGDRLSAKNSKIGSDVYVPTIENIASQLPSTIDAIIKSLFNKGVDKANEKFNTNIEKAGNIKGGLVTSVEDMLMFVSTLADYSGFNVSIQADSENT